MLERALRLLRQVLFRLTDRVAALLDEVEDAVVVDLADLPRRHSQQRPQAVHFEPVSDHVDHLSVYDVLQQLVFYPKHLPALFDLLARVLGEQLGVSVELVAPPADLFVVLGLPVLVDLPLFV